jgi:hypothetical protein
VGGALVGAGVGAVTAAVLVSNHHNGWCTYRSPHGHVYNARCRY